MKPKKKIEMHTQVRALEKTKLWDFIKRKIEKEYNVKVVLLRTEVGIKGNYDNVCKIVLDSCTKKKGVK